MEGVARGIYYACRIAIAAIDDDDYKGLRAIVKKSIILLQNSTAQQGNRMTIAVNKKSFEKAIV